MTPTRSFRIYLVALSLLGLSLLGFLARLSPGAAWTLERASAAALWTLCLILAEISPIPLPRGGARVKLTPVLDLGALLVFGPAIACGLGLFSRLLAFGLERDGAGLRLATELSRAAVTLGGAGLAWCAAGGALSPGWIFPASPVRPLVAAPLAYFVLKTGVDTLLACLREGRPALALWRGATRWEPVHDLLLLPFGLLLAETWYEAGASGVALFLVPLLLARYSFRLWSDTKRAHLATVRTLVAVLDAGDPYTQGQAVRVTRYAGRVARHLGLPEGAREELEYGALLHDIGRRFLQHGVLLKRGRLEGDEVRMMQTHPQLGHDLIRSMPFMEGAAELVLCHHEQPDGRGYPRHLSGREIPPGARILMVAAAFDAMTVDRPYRRGMPAELACQELERCAGTQFFPEAVAALVELCRAGRLCEDFTPEELETVMQGSTVTNRYEGFLAELRMTFDAGEQPTIELSAELLARLEGAMARPVAATPVGQEAGAAPAPGAEGGGDPATDDVPEAADDQAEGDSRKAVNA